MTYLLWTLLVVLIGGSIGTIIVVLMQDSKSAGLGGAFGGNTDSFFGRNKSKTKESKLARLTKIFASVVAVASVAVVVILQLM